MLRPGDGQPRAEQATVVLAHHMDRSIRVLMLQP